MLDGRITVAFIEKQIKESPEATAIWLTYFLMPRDMAMELLGENIADALEKGAPEAADALRSIEKALSKTTDEELGFIHHWAHRKFKKAGVIK